MVENNLLWSPSESRIKSSELYSFFNYMKEKYSLPGECDYDTLYKFSINRPQIFWTEIFHYYKISFEGDLNPACEDLGFENYTWFKNVKLNFAKNLLKNGHDNDCALIEIIENHSTREITYKDLRSNVKGLSLALKNYLKEGEVLACYMSNTAQTITSMLACSSLGGVFTSTSCDFGIEGVLDRFGQSNPSVLVAAASYMYGGKVFDQLPKIKEIANKIPSIKKILIVDILGLGIDNEVFASIPNAQMYEDFFKPENGEIRYTLRKFSDPQYIMYSSGTTGKPKCIVHSVGGTLLQHVKELGLHSDLKRDKNIFFFTTCGWMMWNWLVSSLYFGSKITLYEGSPAHPSFNEYVSIIEKYKINIFGTSPKYLKALQDSNTNLSSINLNSLETILSTGAPLLPEQYDYVYSAFKADLLLASISGGTDILGCFFLGSPINKVYRGELQVRGLGMAVSCFDEQGRENGDGEGELVCLKSFPSRPIYFLNDIDNKKINEAYFNTFKGVWHHGDFIQITNNLGARVLGRSDATLNPGGVRIGTAEIYRQTESLNFIEDSICVGHQNDGDVDVILFVKLKNGQELNPEMIKEIKRVIKVNTTPRHVPRRVIQVTDIPYTRSGKKVELAVTKLINKRAITNLEAIVNPDCLAEYKL